MRPLLCVLASLALSVSAQQYTINVSESFSGQTSRQTIEQLYTQLYAPLGIKPTLIFYPSKRGLQLVNTGQVDAEAGRFHMIAKDYANLVQIKEPINIFYTGFYCLKKEHCNVTQHTSIVASSAFRSAHLLCQANNLNCRFESNPKVIARMLERDIAHVLLSIINGATPVLCAMNDAPVFYKNEPGFKNFSYHYVHKKHSSLVAKLEKSMRNLKQSGQVSRDAIPVLIQRYSCQKSIFLIE